MRLEVVKNTVLLFVLVMISCASKTKNDRSVSDKITNQIPGDTSIVTGANQIEAYIPLLKNQRVGIVANPTSVIFCKRTSTKLNLQNKLDTAKQQKKVYTHLVDSLLKLNINIKKVFSPEHGFRGTGDAGEAVKDDIDTQTQLPLLSLHGKHKKPTDKHLEDLDVIVFDIQDVGVRFYTYISTLHYVMEACAEQKIPLIILDRPNPNGHYIDGPTLNSKHRSFLGMHPVPLVHGMTIGEYAQMINGEGWLANGVTCDITVIKMLNYTHKSPYSLPVRPSPNLPNDQAIMLYPSLGLFEGTNVNAGRGTEFQFQRYGAPFLDKGHYSFSYTPVPNQGAKYPKHEHTLCYGQDLSKINIKNTFTLKYIIEAYRHTKDSSLFFISENFTAHAGTTVLQQQIESGMSETQIKGSWKADLDAYKATRKKYIIYN